MEKLFQFRHFPFLSFPVHIKGVLVDGYLSTKYELSSFNRFGELTPKL